MWFRRLPWLFVLAIAANLFELVSLTILPWNGGIYGINFAPTRRPWVWGVTAVDKQARASGLMPGDLIDFRESFYVNPGRDANWLLETKPFIVVAHRGARILHVSVPLKHTPISWDQTIRLMAVFWVIAFAFLIFKKGTATREQGYLTLILLLLALESPIGRTAIPYNWPGFVYNVLGNPAFNLMCLALAFYGLQHRRPLARSSKMLLYLAIAANVASYCVLWFEELVQYVAPVVNFGSGPYPWVHAGGFALPLLVGLLVVADAIRYAPASDRQRLAWVVAAFAPFLIGPTLGMVLNDPVWSEVWNISLFFVPAALTYAALSRRLFDLGFVLNRAAVFAGVSAIVVGAFVLLEWALAQWFEGLSHASSLAINAGLALVLGISFRVIHQHVDRAVDTIFFRKRHENETALRRFAREAAFFTDGDALAAQTTAMVFEHSDVGAVRIVYANQLDANDPAVAAMKAWQAPVDLSKRATAIEGEVAFPMLAHGALVGAIVCGAKKSGEHFAPDEMETLQLVAHGVGLALDGLRRNGPEDGALSRMEHRLMDAIAQMPAAIAREFRATPVE